YNTSGIFPWILSHQSFKSNLQGFSNDIRDVSGYNYNNRYFDRIFLNKLSEEDWKEQINFVQKTLTDNLIKTAVRRLPDTVYALSGKRIIQTLIARRSALRKEALKYYRFISKRVDITGSEKPERFQIEHKENGDIGVSIYKMKENGAAKNVFYSRTFDHHHTKEIRLYGIGGKDIFSVTGTQKSPIKVRMIGGEDVDSFHVHENLNNKRKLYIYDRSDQENKLPAPSLVRIKTSSDSLANRYDPHNFKYDKLGPVLTVFYTLDQGTMYRAGLNYEKHGFRKEPFAEKHLVSVNYSTARHSFMLEYSGYLTKVIKDNDLSIDLVSRGPKNVTNFFGTGNETPFISTERSKIDYYRNRYDLFSADVRLRRRVSKSVGVSAGVIGQYYTSSALNNTTHFFEKYNTSHPDENIFSNRLYGGIVAGAVVDTRNEGIFASKGIFWNTEVTVLNQFNGARLSTGSILSELNFYIPLSRDSNVVIANRIGGGTTVGSPAFYQQMQLGGSRTLRGFHTFRFTGKSMFFHNLDLRCKLFDFTSYLFPGSIGVVGFNDIGRVWVPGEASNKWHHGYGGGMYIIPAELILVQAVFGHSVEGTFPYISIGFTF
ncbi:MAG TPA: BamA/TamA family outer membrane protein, partial [Segetibacter sp.]